MSAVFRRWEAFGEGGLRVNWWLKLFKLLGWYDPKQYKPGERVLVDHILLGLREAEVVQVCAEEAFVKIRFGYQGVTVEVWRPAAEIIDAIEGNGSARTREITYESIA